MSSTVGAAVSPAIDFSLPFVCEQLTPLYYAEVYGELTKAQRVRYTQLAAMHFNEVITFFEESIAGPVLSGLGRSALPAELRHRLATFAEDERRHTRMFRDLNRQSAPEWYASGDRFFVQPRRLERAVIEWFASRPGEFPAVIWLMLVLEEKSLSVSRALLNAGDAVEPHYRDVYRAHLEDEGRHVQIDHRLLGLLYAGRPAWKRRVNAWLFCTLLVRAFLSPDRSSAKVVERLVQECQELAPLLPRLQRELRGVGANPEYRAMMYSPGTCPQTFALVERYPELGPLRRELAP